MIDPTAPIVVPNSSNNTNTTKKPTGFQLNPEGINRNGRPKKDWTWKELLQDTAEEFADLKKKDGTIVRGQYKKLVAARLYKEAVNGNIGAIKELMNRMDGMPVQKAVVEQHGNWNITLKRDNA